MPWNQRSLLLGLGVAVLCYAIAVLGFVALSPDLRLRAFLVDERATERGGIVIRQVPGLRLFGDGRGQRQPKPGDTLLKVGAIATPTLLDFFDANEALYRPRWDVADPVNPTDDPKKDWSQLSWLIQDGRRHYVETRFRPAGERQTETCWIELQSVPTGELVLTFLWLLPQLGILAVAAAAIWQRPFDRSARLFYVMCLVQLGAHVGGYHWWTIANSGGLTFPFFASAVLLPAVTLHFFLVFPRPVALAVRWPRILLFGLYAIPAAGIACGAAFLAYAAFFDAPVAAVDAEGVGRKVAILSAFRHGIDVGIAAAAAYYALTLAALIRAAVVTRDPSERAQVRWILGAAILATLPVGYTVWLAATDRAAFAFGDARLPMFAASFGFSLAYSVGMLRHRLMLADQILTTGLWYYLARSGLTLGVAAGVAALSVAATVGDTLPLRPQSSAALAAVILLTVLLLLWGRDRLQQALDRRFFSEKYRLGVTLRGVHDAADLLADDDAVGRRVLESCREVLDVGRAAVYRADGDVYRLTAAVGDFPAELNPGPGTLDPLRTGGNIQRVPTDGRGGLSPAQSLLRGLNAQLLYAPHAGDGTSTLLVLGPKANGDLFTAEDLAFLSAVGHVTDVALDGAEAHRRLSDELRHREQAIAGQTRQIAGQTRQIAVLQAELADLHRRQGTATTAADEEPFRREALRGESPAITQVLETVRKVAGSDSTVLVRGESGTGKELLAQILHDNSPRRTGPLVRVHCAALTPTLLESELFGHVKGAFTGADRDKVGRFQLADGGTLFLDEIGDITPETQVKLLRVLQERTFEPVGSSQTMKVDVRLVTATNRNLEEMIADGRFREDLYYRLNVITVTLPPLRERREDVLDLAYTFLSRAARRLNKPVTGIDDEALAILGRHRWPGNVRELQNVIERAVVLADGDAITAAELPAELAPLRPAGSPPIRRIGDGIRASAVPDGRGAAPPAGRRPRIPRPSAGAERSERERLVAALAEAGGNKAEAARLVGLPRSTFFSKLKKYDLS